MSFRKLLSFKLLKSAWKWKTMWLKRIKHYFTCSAISYFSFRRRVIYAAEAFSRIHTKCFKLSHFQIERNRFIYITTLLYLFASFAGSNEEKEVYSVSLLLPKGGIKLFQSPQKDSSSSSRRYLHVIMPFKQVISFETIFIFAKNSARFDKRQSFWWCLPHTHSHNSLSFPRNNDICKLSLRDEEFMATTETYQKARNYILLFCCSGMMKLWGSNESNGTGVEIIAEIIVRNFSVSNLSFTFDDFPSSFHVTDTPPSSCFIEKRKANFILVAVRRLWRHVHVYVQRNQKRSSISKN